MRGAANARAASQNCAEISPPNEPTDHRTESPRAASLTRFDASNLDYFIALIFYLSPLMRRFKMIMARPHIFHLRIKQLSSLKLIPASSDFVPLELKKEIDSDVGCFP